MKYSYLKFISHPCVIESFNGKLIQPGQISLDKKQCIMSFQGKQIQKINSKHLVISQDKNPHKTQDMINLK